MIGNTVASQDETRLISTNVRVAVDTRCTTSNTVHVCVALSAAYKPNNVILCVGARFTTFNAPDQLAFCTNLSKFQVCLFYSLSLRLSNTRTEVLFRTVTVRKCGELDSSVIDRQMRPSVFSQHPINITLSLHRIKVGARMFLHFPTVSPMVEREREGGGGGGGRERGEE